MESSGKTHLFPFSFHCSEWVEVTLKTTVPKAALKGFHVQYITWWQPDCSSGVHGGNKCLPKFLTQQTESTSRNV